MKKLYQILLTVFFSFSLNAVKHANERHVPKGYTVLKYKRGTGEKTMIGFKEKGFKAYLAKNRKINCIQGSRTIFSAIGQRCIELENQKNVLKQEEALKKFFDICKSNGCRRVSEEEAKSLHFSSPLILDTPKKGCKLGFEIQDGELIVDPGTKTKKELESNLEYDIYVKSIEEFRKYLKNKGGLKLFKATPENVLKSVYTFLKNK